jgi:hypothetical protein
MASYSRLNPISARAHTEVLEFSTGGKVRVDEAGETVTSSELVSRMTGTKLI